MSGERVGVGADLQTSIGEVARREGLDTRLLYEAVIELANEGLLTARCLNAAAGILLKQLGLPAYYFRHISKQSLKSALRVIATNVKLDQSQYVLSDDVAHLECSVGGDVEVFVATSNTREYMERVVGQDIIDRRWEYYYSHRHDYTTYILKPEQCKPLGELAADESRFAFARREGGRIVPEETGRRYEDFLDEYRRSVTRPVKFSLSRKNKETRIMFHKSMTHTSLPIIRQILSDRKLRLNRAYGETYRSEHGEVASVCSFYVSGKFAAHARRAVAADIRSFLALGENPFDRLYLSGDLSFPEMLFSVNASFLVHQFIYRESAVDSEIMASLHREDLRAALAQRISDANRSEYTRRVIADTLSSDSDLVRELFTLFDRRFNPAVAKRLDPSFMARRLSELGQRLDRRFVDDSTSLDIFRFMCRLLPAVQKTNFYLPDKRSFAFRLGSGVLDPVVFTTPVYGIFLVVGHHALGTHMRADDIARGGLRLMRSTPANYENQLDDVCLLNYELGPQAQRLKHKDIAESGSKGVIVPTPAHAAAGLSALHDFCEGILDLVLPSPDVVDHFGTPEMLFFGPDEGTADFMDALAERSKERGYAHWRTLTTGKSIGIPHDAFGLTEAGEVFALLGRGDRGTELLLEGASRLTTCDVERIDEVLGGSVRYSGITTTGVLACFRALTDRHGDREEDLNLMMTGGPDGDLGANQIQCYRGRICLIIDGGGVLFDPDGLDKRQLRLLAMSRHTTPRLDSTAYPRDLLGPRGFLVERTATEARFPDGTVTSDGAFFHRTFLTTPENRRFIEEANIRAFIPCGGQKHTIDFSNVDRFLSVFGELAYIVEGANVFFDDAAREEIASGSDILQIKDSTANKGGVTCSSLAEVLAAFVLQDDYEACLLEDTRTRFKLVREVMDIIVHNAKSETMMLLDLSANEPGTSLATLSVRTSEQLLALQRQLCARLDSILGNEELVSRALAAYVPRVLVDCVGMETVRERLGVGELVAYRNAMLTKRLASLALYRHAGEWDVFLARLDIDFQGALAELLATDL